MMHGHTNLKQTIYFISACTAKNKKFSCSYTGLSKILYIQFETATYYTYRFYILATLVYKGLVGFLGEQRIFPSITMKMMEMHFSCKIWSAF